MNELLELQSGQVAFLSGILAGFAMTASLHIMRLGVDNRMSQFVFWVSTLSSLLFVVALYIDVRLTLELAGKENISQNLLERISSVRIIGTSSASAAMFLFIVSIAMLGWLTPRRITGVVTTTMGLLILLLLAFIWFQIGGISAELNAA